MYEAWYGYIVCPLRGPKDMGTLGGLCGLRCCTLDFFSWLFHTIRYFCTVCAFRCGVPVSKPALIALSKYAMGGLHKLWWPNLMLFVLVVCV
jgi:hypothetical protein